MMQLLLAEREMLYHLSLNAWATSVLSPAYMREDALSTFRHLHKAGLVEPVTPGCNAYHASIEGRKALYAARGPGVLDMVLRTEED